MEKRVLWMIQRDDRDGGDGDWCECTDALDALSILENEYSSLADCDRRRIINLYAYPMTIFKPETAEEQKMIENWENDDSVIPAIPGWWQRVFDGDPENAVYYIKNGKIVGADGENR